jgi:hypothetical protein
MKWDEEVIAALRKAGRPLRSGEIAAAVMGYEHGPSIIAISLHVPKMARRGLLAKVEGSPYNRYTVKEAE